MSGQWLARHRTYNLVGQPSGQPLDPDLTTFSEVLSNGGYATRYVGGWHLGHENEGGPEQFGFDRWIRNGGYTVWRDEHDIPDRPSPDAESGWFGSVDQIDPEESRLSWGVDHTIEQLDELANRDDPFSSGGIHSNPTS